MSSATRRHIVLVGLPGAGKTSVGKALSVLLDADFSEPDRLIEARLNASIQSIFADRGEAGFRKYEAEIMADLLKKPPHVISPGGGWVLGAHESGTTLSRGLIIYLETSPAEVLSRLGGAAGRPVLGDGSLSTVERLYEDRRGVYEASEVTVKTDGKNLAEVIQAVLDLARNKAGW